jgi:4-amino-4-deoxy-L-arabinose transferase-like glycosyltransferase
MTTRNHQQHHLPLLPALRPLLARPLEWARGRLWPFAALLLALALLPRLFRLGAQSLWLDEGSTWQMTRSDWGALFLDMLNPSSGYPLYHLLLKGWLALAGSSEWALRFPSALAGAAAVVALYLTAREFQRFAGDLPGSGLFPLAGALLLAGSPFALWYAQEAKVYSLLLLVSVLLLGSLLRALRQPTRRAWLLFGALALLIIFVHRLASLLLVAAWVAWLLTTRGNQRERAAHWLGVALASGALVAGMATMLTGDLSETGAAIPADPATALWLALLRFSLDRGPDEFVGWWLLPWAALLAWGGALLLRDALSGPRAAAARVLLCWLLVPLVLFLAQLAFTHLYESRYLMLIYPAWLLTLAYPLAVLRPLWPRVAAGALLAGALLSGTAALLQPPQGLFSGYPVKEQYRAAVGVLARHVHPDDAVIVHPSYIQPLYDYYMPRLSADPPPEPITFAAFKHFQTVFNQRDWDEARRRELAGYVRSFLLIAPHHARTVDKPRDDLGDEYGLVGLYFQHTSRLEKWPCGIWRFQGVHVLCQDSPEAYETGVQPQPATPLAARFGGRLLFEGYTLKATTSAGPGTYRAGGTLPITLFWDVTEQPTQNYRVFLHLCQQCAQPPAAATDGEPLGGYLPTSVWLPGNLVHDERAIPLPPDLEPGRYRLLLGVYPVGSPTEAARLPIRGAPTLPGARLPLGSVEIVR